MQVNNQGTEGGDVTMDDGAGVGAYIVTTTSPAAVNVSEFLERTGAAPLEILPQEATTMSNDAAGQAARVSMGTASEPAVHEGRVPVSGVYGSLTPAKRALEQGADFLQSAMKAGKVLMDATSFLTGQ